MHRFAPAIALAFTVAAMPASAAVILTDAATGVMLKDGDNGLDLQVHSDLSQIGTSVLAHTKPGIPVGITLQSQSKIQINGNGYAHVEDASATDGQKFDDLDIFLTAYPQGFDGIEFSVQYSGFKGRSPAPAYLYLTADLLGGGSVNFSPLLVSSNGLRDYQIIGDGNDIFTRLSLRSYTSPAMTTGFAFDQIKQIDIELVKTPVPAPAIWGMMLLGFGGIGVAMRRNRRNRAVSVNS